MELNRRVRRLTADDGRFGLEADDRTLSADQVVVATGPFQTPYVPDVAGRLGPDVFQTHSTGYRRPGDVPQAGTVLVVGGGNTGFQIAKELSGTHEVVLSVGSRQTPLPQRFLGRDLFWWLTKARLFDTTAESRLGPQAATSRDADRLEPARAPPPVLPGLYFLGLTWQHTRGSALIGWVKDDAQFIAGEIAALQEAPGAPVEPGRAAERRRERV